MITPPKRGGRSVFVRTNQRVIKTDRSPRFYQIRIHSSLLTALAGASLPDAQKSRLYISQTSVGRLVPGLEQ